MVSSSGGPTSGENRRVGRDELMRVIVTGASGQLGRRTAEHVLELRGPDGVILVTRQPESIADLAAHGADVRFGDFDQPESLAASGCCSSARPISSGALDSIRRRSTPRWPQESATSSTRRVYAPSLRTRRSSPQVITRPRRRSSTAAWRGPSCGTASTPSIRRPRPPLRPRAEGWSTTAATDGSRTCRATTALQPPRPCSSARATRRARTT